MIHNTENTAIQGNKRDHQYLEGDYHRSDHQTKQDPAGFPLVTHDSERRHRGQQDRENRGKNGNAG